MSGEEVGGTMRRIALAVLLIVSCTLLVAKSKPINVEFKDGKGASVGTAKITGKGKGSQIHLDVKGLAPGTHAIHVHENATCEGPDFKSAGAHLNPDKKQHGADNPQGAHKGDLPNFEVKPDGTAKATVNARSIDSASLNNVSLVIHEKADDYKTDPSGNSGARIACAVVKQ
jgi:Cu-Zn family superoxide dismutase